MISTDNSQSSHQSVELLISDNINLISSPSIFFELKSVVDDPDAGVSAIN